MLFDYALLAFATSFACSDTFVNRFLNAEESLKINNSNNSNNNNSNHSLKSKLTAQLRVLECIAPHLSHISIAQSSSIEIDPVALVRGDESSQRQQLATVFQFYSLRYETIARLIICLHNIYNASSTISIASTTTATTNVKRKLDDNDGLLAPSIDRRRAQLARNILLILANDKRCRHLLTAGIGLFPPG